MAKKKSLKMVWIFVIIAVIVIAAVIYFMFFRSNTKMPDENKSDSVKNPNNTTYQSPFPLKKGSSDGDKSNMTGRVHKVQNWLNNKIKVPYSSLSLDGIWGNNTEETIKAKIGINEINETFYNAYVLTGLYP